jgi:hypothetical protein
MVVKWLPFFQKKRKISLTLEPSIEWNLSGENAKREGEKPDLFRLFALSIFFYLPTTSVIFHSGR